MGLTTQQILASIENGTTSLGIEFGSTRIKAVLTARTIHRSHREAMIGKTVWKTVYGRILWRISGQDFKTVMRRWQKM